MQLINYTPHTIRLFKDDKLVLEIPSSGTIRLASNKYLVEWIDIDNEKFPISVNTYDLNGCLPPVVRGTLYIVSRLVAEISKREDFIIPDNTVRDASQSVIGCRGFACV